MSQTLDHGQRDRAFAVARFGTDPKRCKYSQEHLAVYRLAVELDCRAAFAIRRVVQQPCRKSLQLRSFCRFGAATTLDHSGASNASIPWGSA